MKLTLFLSAFLFSLFSMAEIANDKICGSKLEARHPVFQTALNNLNSFGYIRKALGSASRGIENPIFCTSMIALSSNAYGYYQYFIQIEVLASKVTPRKFFQTPGYRFHFIFQDASVQAFHNVGGQPWTGIDPTAVQKTAERLISSSRFSDFRTYSDDLLDLARKSKTYRAQAGNLNPDTVSVVKLPVTASDAQYFLVTWLTNYQNSNPFVSTVMTQGVLLRKNADRSVQTAENIAPGSDFLFPLEENSDLVRNSLSENHQEWTQKLLEIGKVP